MTASCGWQKGNNSGDNFSQAESSWRDIELVRDAKENFQVWKVSQIKTKGEIKDSLFKAIDDCTECAQWIVQLLHYGHSVV